MSVVENGIRVEHTAPPPTATRCGSGLGSTRRRATSHASRLHPVKDHAMLLRAFRSVAMSRADVDLLLIGDGPLREELHALVRSLGIPDRVHFLGVRSDVPDLLARRTSSPSLR